MTEATLRAGLLTRLGPMLLVLLLLDAVACYYTALHFANVVYDQWLADSARSLAQALVVRDAAVGFDLPAVGREVFQFDELDRTYFRVRSARQGDLAGEPRLPVAGPARPKQVSYADGVVGADDVRVATIVVTPPGTAEAVTISVGETTRKRGRLTVEIVLGMVAPQVGLLLFAAGFAWSGVSRGLKPLTDLAGIIESRDDRNLQPLPEANLPREARVLVHEINQLLARLGSSLEANLQFLARAAHQLRTPLAAVVLHAEQAERAPDLPAARQALGTLRRAVERAVRLTAQLLAVARAEPEVPTPRGCSLPILRSWPGRSARRRCRRPSHAAWTSGSPCRTARCTSPATRARWPTPSQTWWTTPCATRQTAAA